MNILEKFISIFKNCIIIISGYEKLHLSEYADQLANDFNFELLEFKYPDFDSLNKKIKDLHENNNNNKGIIIYGLTFPKEKLEFKVNYHVSLSANKTLVDDENEYNLYNNNVKENFINKFKNVKIAAFNEELYDDIYNTCIDFVMKKVYGENYEKAQKKYIEDTASETADKQIESVKDEEDDTNDLSESSGGSYKRNIVKGTRRILKKAPKKTTKKTSKKTSKKGSRKGSMKGGNERKKTSKPKKLKRVIGTRLLMNVIKV
jgi:replication initiation and membrane attachment protein DnaB